MKSRSHIPRSDSEVEQYRLETLYADRKQLEPLKTNYLLWLIIRLVYYVEDPCVEYT